jgi:ribosome-associated protein
MTTETLTLDGDYIELCTLLKIAGPTVSGGMAKHLIADGLVFVDDVIETRKKCKIKAGQTVIFDEFEIKVLAPNTSNPN